MKTQNCCNNLKGTQRSVPHAPKEKRALLSQCLLLS